MGEDSQEKRITGTGLALSGGGFRATLFHIGSLWRLNEAGFLPKLNEITSVSGGSIVAGYLGLKWNNLVFDGSGQAVNFEKEIVKPLCEFCAKTVDVGSIIVGILLPFSHPSDFVIAAYNKHLFHEATLQNLPSDDEGPRFTIYATSLQTGASVRFSRPYLAEYRIGMITSPQVPLAKAVAASSAFPPVLCPVVLETDPKSWEPLKGADLHTNKDLRSKLILGDGGIYDNIGLERLWDYYETVIVSDAGAPFDVQYNSFFVKFSQVARTKRTLDIMGEQCRALRKRKLINDFKAEKLKGTYWGIYSQTKDYKLTENGLPGPMVNDNEVTAALSKLRTRLNSFNEREQGQLINWGYALADTALRRHVLPPDTTHGKWPAPKYQLQ